MNKTFKRRIAGILLLSVCSEWRTEKNQKHFVSLAFLQAQWVFFELVFRSGEDSKDSAGFFTCFGKFYADAMTLEAVEPDEATRFEQRDQLKS